MSYYFSENPDVKSKEVTTKAEVCGSLYVFKTDNNVLSKKGLDYGTRILLESLNYEEIKGNILDFGCGYGPIGIVVSSKTNSDVDMVDINLRALLLARKNAMLNKVSVNIFKSNVYENVDKKYDYIITNPPIRVGKKILYEILIGAKDYLNEKGKLIFVINKDQGAKSAMRDLGEFYNVKILNKSGGFFIISCEKY